MVQRGGCPVTTGDDGLAYGVRRVGGAVMDEQQQDMARLIGKRIRTLRGERGLSLRVLADLAGVSHSYLSMVESGKRLLKDTAYINAIAEALRVAPPELLGHPFLPVDPYATEVHAAIALIYAVSFRSRLPLSTIDR
jgi:transcriptional regulator with XRE-family HTH domain